MATITLEYTVDPPQNLPFTKVAAKLSAVDVFLGELDLLGYVLQSDNTVGSPAEIKRTVVLMTTPVSDARFPTDEARIYSTRSLYKGTLGLQLPGRVEAADPVVAP